MFLKLTFPNNDDMLINIDKIKAVTHKKDKEGNIVGCSIFLQDKQYDLLNSLNSINTMLQNLNLMYNA